MSRHTSIGFSLISALPRFALLAAMLLAPVAAMHAAQAGADSHIEDSRKFSSGAGLVLVAGLQRV